jgi:hypothetical protein
MWSDKVIKRPWLSKNDESMENLDKTELKRFESLDVRIGDA